VTSAVERKAANFRKWLAAHGAEILAPTNPYEVMRFRGNGQISIVRTNARGRNSFVGEAEEAWEAFRKGASFRFGARVKRRRRSDAVVTAIRQRDGDLCFFCREPVDEDDESIEHLVPVIHQGPNHLSNLALAHRQCNSDAGHQDAMTKISAHVAAEVRRLSERLYMESMS
jgi:hypothetical protein